MNVTEPIAPSSMWTLDPMHTTVGFSLRHLMITNVRGQFREVTGTARYEPEHPERTELRASIPVASIDTRVSQRDAHLRSADFFDAERHPTITFASTQARGAGPGRLELAGALTIRGVTREIVLTVSDLGYQRDHNGLLRLGAAATGRLRRSDFGITYNKLLEAGAVAIADEVSLTFDVSLLNDMQSR